MFLTNLFGENCMEKLAADTNWSHKYTCQDTGSDRHRVCRNKSLVYMCWELKNNLFAEQEKDGEQSSRAHGKNPNPGAGGSCLEQECASVFAMLCRVSSSSSFAFGYSFAVL